MINKACLLPFTVLFVLLNLQAQNTKVEMNAFLDMDPEKSIIKNTESSKNYTKLLEVMKASNLEEILSYSGPFTVFAPSDRAFKKMSQTRLTALLDPKNKKELHAFMTYHIVAGNFSASKILKAMCRGEGKASFTTVQGDKLIASMDGVDIILTDNLGNTAKIIVADSNQCNGVIHEIDTVFQAGTM